MKITVDKKPTPELRRTALIDQSPPETLRSRLTRLDFGLLAASVLVLVTAGIIYASKRVMWVDEVLAYSILTEKSYSEILRVASDIIGSPPVYYFIGHTWGLIFGYSEFSLRMMSMVFMISSYCLIWVLLRRYYSVLGTAIGVMTAYFLSELILYQDVEIRFYGVHLFEAALMLWVYDWITRPSVVEHDGLAAGDLGKYLVLLTLTFVWGMTHLYGLIYSGLMLGALVISDLLRSRFRPMLYTAVPIAWGLFFLLWSDILRVQHRIFELKGWFSGRPNVMDMLLAASGYIHPVYLGLLLLFGAVGVLEVTRGGSLSASGNQGTQQVAGDDELGPGRLVLCIVGFAWAISPMIAWVLCQIITPAYMPRYMIPAIAGYAIMFTHLAERVVVPRYMNLDNRYLFRGRLRPAAMAAYLAALLFVPILQAVVTKPMPFPGKNDGAVGYTNLPEVFEHAHDFAPRAFYAGPANRYWYVLDKQTAVAPMNSGHAAKDYVIEQNLGQHYPSVFNVIEVNKFLEANPEFLVFHRVNNPGHRWAELRLMNRPDYKVTEVGVVGECVVYHVQRVKPAAAVAATQLTQR